MASVHPIREGDGIVLEGRSHRKQPPQFICDRKELHFLAVNDAAISQYGYSHADFAKMTLRDLGVPEELPVFGNFCRRALSARRQPDWQYEREFRHRTRTGSTIEVELDILPARWKGIPVVSVMSRNITARKRAERRLRAQHAIAEALSESASVAEASPRIFKAICKALGCDWGELWRLNDARDALRCSEIWTPGGRSWPDFEAARLGKTFRCGQGLAGLVWARNKPMWLLNLKVRPFARSVAAAATKYGLRSAYGFPIRLNNEVLGVIAIFSREVVRPDKLMLQMLKSTTHQIGQMMGRRRAERHLMEVSEQEQERIGQDLHDSLCQELAGIRFLAKNLSDRLETRSSPDRKDAARIADLLTQTVEHTRKLAYGLKPVRSEPRGLMNALQELTGTIESLFLISCRFACVRRVAAPSHSTANHLYRIAQEAIHNAIKHGKAERIIVALTGQNGSVNLTIRDNGRGFGGRAPQSRGMGLGIMQQRAHTIGAQLEIRSRRTGGTIVTCRLPTNGESSS